jgi:hypothetical protein
VRRGREPNESQASVFCMFHLPMKFDANKPIPFVPREIRTNNDENTLRLQSFVFHSIGLTSTVSDSFSRFASVHGDAVRLSVMPQEETPIVVVCLIVCLVVVPSVNCKSGGGHYSSQRSLAAGPSAGHGLSAGNQLQSSMHWGNSLLPFDMNNWYDYGT